MVVAYIPQVIQILQTHLVRDINLLMNILIFLAVVMMECYAIYLKKVKNSGLAFLITNTMSMLQALFYLVLILIYK